MSQLKNIALLSLLLVAAYFGLWSPGEHDTTASVESQRGGSQGQIEQAFRNRATDLQLTLEGRVKRVLSDDREGSRHQRFIINVESGRTLLVAHNIDLAPRVKSLKPGDHVQIHGVYEWNDKGGVVHWTHHDPQGRHEGGWIKHQGQTYQ
ncbi:MAG: DUF3465 domain-containing protein [Candidatus Thiodiazotropha taylori]|nr:DUF3465 domain-containing protein [Candidatus Thiodiazotropha taylori]